MNLLRTLFTVSGMTLISRILGFVRDAVIAANYLRREISKPGRRRRMPESVN